MNPEQPTPAAPRPAFLDKITAIVFIVFCFELGIFLLVFPWLEYWGGNWFFQLQPAWREFWMSPHLRGFVSGLGILNLAIAFIEILRLRRFSRG
jgi:hypothetical protein